MLLCLLMQADPFLLPYTCLLLDLVLAAVHSCEVNGKLKDLKIYFCLCLCVKGCAKEPTAPQLTFGKY